MRTTLQLVAVLAFVWSSPLFLRAAEPKPPQRTHTIGVADYFTQAWLFDELAVSPDGKFVAYPEGRWQESTNDRSADLWVVDCATGMSRRLTFDRAGDRNIQWSADGKQLYFTGRRKREGETKPPYNGKTQVWRIDVDGGRLQSVTFETDGIGSFKLGDTSLYYSTSKDVQIGEWKELKAAHGSVNYGNGPVEATVIWKLDLNTWRKKRLVDDSRVIRDFAVAADTGRIGMITTPDDTTVSFEGESEVDIFDPASGKTTRVPSELWRKDAPSPYACLDYLAWSPDGEALAFNAIYDAYPCEILVAHWNQGKPKVTQISRPECVSIHAYGSKLGWRGKRELCFLGDHKARIELWCIDEVTAAGQGKAQRLTPADYVAGAFSFSDAGAHCAVLMNETTHPEDIFLIKDDKSHRRLTKLNPQIDDWKLPQISIVSWKGCNGDTVEGILELPPDYKRDKPLPLVVSMHGGPTSAAKFHFEFWPFEGRVLMASQGYALLSPNYRGSTGYGDNFLKGLVGRINDVEVTDILAGVDHLIKEGIADKDRLGVMGWSYGGYLSNCLICGTDRFKAASSGGTVTDFTMQWGASDESAFAKVFLQGRPWEKPAAYQKASPLFALRKIKTATIIHVGEADERCPPEHGRMLYRTLVEEIKDRQAELLVYPGEGHTPARYNSRKAKMEWDLKWFDKYVKGAK